MILLIISALGTILYNYSLDAVNYQKNIFESDIKILKDGLEVNGKSIMGVMMLAAEPGSELVFVIDGTDEELAIDAIIDLIDKNFHEE